MRKLIKKALKNLKNEPQACILDPNLFKIKIINIFFIFIYSLEFNKIIKRNCKLKLRIHQHL